MNTDRKSPETIGYEVARSIIKGLRNKKYNLIQLENILEAKISETIVTERRNSIRSYNDLKDELDREIKKKN